MRKAGQKAWFPGGTGLSGIKFVLGSAHGEPHPKVNTVLTQTWGGDIWFSWKHPHTMLRRQRQKQSLEDPKLPTV